MTNVALDRMWPDSESDALYDLLRAIYIQAPRLEHCCLENVRRDTSEGESAAFEDEDKIELAGRDTIREHLPKLLARFEYNDPWDIEDES